MTIKIELEPLQIIDLVYELRLNAQAYLRLGMLEDNVKCSLLAHSIEVQYDSQQPTQAPQANDNHI